MPFIKTKKAIKETIKTIDKTAAASRRIKRAYIATKDKAEHSVFPTEENQTEYAYNKLGHGANTTVRAVHHIERSGKKGIKETKMNIVRVKNKIEKFKTRQEEKKKEQEKSSSAHETVQTRDDHLKSDSYERNNNRKSDSVFSTNENRANPKIKQTTDSTKTNRSPKDEITKPVNQVKKNTTATGRKSIKTTQETGKTVKQSAKSGGKTTVKTVKSGAKPTQKGIKTAEKTAKTSIKTTKEAANVTQKVAEKAAKASQKAARAAKEAARATVKATVTAIKIAAKTTASTIKAIIAGTKALIAALAAGGSVAIAIVIVIGLIAMLAGSIFGIFFSGEDSGTGQTVQTAVCEINDEFNSEIERIKSSTRYDYLDMSGGTAAWKDVLVIYSVKVNGNPGNANEIATMDDAKRAQLKEIFWKMNTITSRTETKYESQGSITVKKVYLYIVVDHKTIDDMINEYGFNETQKTNIQELLKPEYDSMWDGILAGI